MVHWRKGRTTSDPLHAPNECRQTVAGIAGKIPAPDGFKASVQLVKRVSGRRVWWSSPDPFTTPFERKQGVTYLRAWLLLSPLVVIGSKKKKQHKCTRRCTCRRGGFPHPSFYLVTLTGFSEFLV
jgi:hypothetical protein